MKSSIPHNIPIKTQAKPILFFIGGLIILGTLGQLSMNREAYLYSTSPAGKVTRVLDSSYDMISHDLQLAVYGSGIGLVLGVVIFVGSAAFLETPEDRKAEKIRELEKLSNLLKKRLARGEISLDEYDEISERVYD